MTSTNTFDRTVAKGRLARKGNTLPTFNEIVAEVETLRAERRARR